nr:CHAP domain-containing protein [Leucobacter sp. cx-169]
MTGSFLSPASAVERPRFVENVGVPELSVSQQLSLPGQAGGSELQVPSPEVSAVEVLAPVQVGPVAGFDVSAAVRAALSEVGSSRPTGWSQSGECIMSAQRWIRAGGGAWRGGGDPVSNYAGATRLDPSDAQPGDVIQYEYAASPTMWVTGVHTLLVVGVNDDGTLHIVESNNPFGSGLVTETASWEPDPPAGFQAVVWRF